MGICTSRSAVSLVPHAHVLSHTDTEDQMSDAGMTTWGELLSMAHTQSIKTVKVTEVMGVRSSGGGGGGSGGGGGPNAPSKGYLELGSKGETGPQTSREAAEEEEEDTEGDGEVEEVVNLSDSEGSLKSELLE